MNEESKAGAKAANRCYLIEFIENMMIFEMKNSFVGASFRSHYVSFYL